MNRATTAMALGLVVLSLAACEPSPERTPWPVAGESSSPGGSEQNGSTDSGTLTFVRTPGETYVPESAPSTNGDGTAGSGCSPGTGRALADGIWRGVIEGVDSDEIEFDLLCSWSFGSETFRKEIAKHEPGDGPIIYVTQNDNPLIRTLPLDPEVAVWPERAGMQPDALNDFLDQHTSGAWREAWIFVNDGVITEMSEVYYPSEDA
jgi:hypothetical protein